MSEIRPQFTYSGEDDVLRVTVSLSEGYKLGNDDPNEEAAFRKGRLEQLADYDDVEIDISDDGDKVAIQIPVSEALGEMLNNRSNDELGGFLDVLRSILPYHPQDDIDRIASLEYLGSRGANGVIYEHMQRWLNTGEITEAQAKEYVGALAMPYHDIKSIKRALTKDYRFDRYSQGTRIDAGMIFGLTTREVPFKVSRPNESDERWGYDRGAVKWFDLDMRTLGDCACWGVDGTSRDHITYSDDAPKRLYEMSPHNIDYARQTLSLVLGLGTLARFAAEYKGSEDIYAEAEWL